MNNDGVLRGNKVIKLDPEQSVVKLNMGDPDPAQSGAIRTSLQGVLHRDRIQVL
jgi:hypothetical protein